MPHLCHIRSYYLLALHAHSIQNNAKHSGVTFEGRPHLTLGGVGRNLATALEFLGHKPTFITSLVQDNLGSFALGELRRTGFSKERLKVVSCKAGANGEPVPASSCFALVLMDSIGGQCEYVIANLDAAKAIDEDAIQMYANLIRRSPILVMDANLPDKTIRYILHICYQHKVPIFLEPTDVVALPRLVNCLKSVQQTDPESLKALMCLSPNLIELKTLSELFGAGNGLANSGKSMTINQVELLANDLMRNHLPFLKCLLITLDKRGVLVAVRSNRADMERVDLMNDRTVTEGAACHMKLFSPPRLIGKPISASGAGDSFAAGFISALLDGSDLSECIWKAFEASWLALQDRDTISSRLKDLSIRNDK